MSSAYFTQLTAGFNSLINTFYSIAPRTVPWGSPMVISLKADMQLLNLTQCWRLVKKSWINLTRYVLNLSPTSLEMVRSGRILSKAWEKPSIADWPRRTFLSSWSQFGRSDAPPGGQSSFLAAKPAPMNNISLRASLITSYPVWRP